VELSVFAYEVLDHLRITVAVLAVDSSGGRDLVWNSTEHVPAPPWIRDSPQDLIAFVAQRLLAISYADER